METLVVEQHKNQYYSRSKSQGHARFGSSPSKNFRGINCRTFQSGIGILPTPLKSHDSPKTPSSTLPLSPKATPKSTPIPINGKACRKETTFTEDVLLSELWAGPTYSNSPPPSSLPIPKFSVVPKRTVSLNLPGSSPEIEMRPVAKSAPPSPGREHLPFTRDLFDNADSATKTLCRILNLNINDE
ncbi:Proline-rich nuclear receptor coactivator motif [Sesbania bispinosa]|nr:Proline-rich nuclear receptor coactivator motif [Sesbania bispinosa]